ncbi:hypothetical protein SLITO_v1c09220 [Spiroplasma litorale]|uniref:Lipoprotein n=1 Tax=Spiroplasma litorale TaxID=216942 RepID=A0A0K1W2Y0_9MOLU|nr:hypothetical protein [Spiroplasma litorale]AKX34533.1 hypothetical protein SLITO_v1c09220 [Spiroplasma litorale]
MKKILTLLSALTITASTLQVVSCGENVNDNSNPNSDEEYYPNGKELTFNETNGRESLINNIKNDDKNKFDLADEKSKYEIKISDKNTLEEDYLETKKIIWSVNSEKEIGDTFKVEGMCFLNMNYIKSYFKESKELPSGYTYVDEDFRGLVFSTFYGKKGESSFTVNIYFINFIAVNDFTVHKIYYKNISLI